MNDMYNRLMSLSDEEFERIEKAEAELVERIGVTKLHEFDNVGIGEDGSLYALENLSVGDEIIKNGVVFAICKENVKSGERIKK